MCFVAIYALFVWRKIVAENVLCGEKITNMMYVLVLVLVLLLWAQSPTNPPPAPTGVCSQTGTICPHLVSFLLPQKQLLVLLFTTKKLLLFLQLFDKRHPIYHFAKSRPVHTPWQPCIRFPPSLHWQGCPCILTRYFLFCQPLLQGRVWRTCPAGSKL